jgi:hypothetical protein
MDVVHLWLGRAGLVKIFFFLINEHNVIQQKEKNNSIPSFWSHLTGFYSSYGKNL